jgi:hypothetical protein
VGCEIWAPGGGANSFSTGGVLVGRGSGRRGVRRSSSSTSVWGIWVLGEGQNGGSASWATPPKGEWGGACTAMDGGEVVAKGRDGRDEGGGGGGGGGGAWSDSPG